MDRHPTDTFNLSGRTPGKTWQMGSERRETRLDHVGLTRHGTEQRKNGKTTKLTAFT